MNAHDVAAPPAPNQPLESPFFWWCSVCQLQVPFGYEQLNQFYHHGWPVCCGETVLGCVKVSALG